MLALAHMKLAGCHADRNANLEEADSSLTAAEKVFERIDARPEINARRTDAYADYQAERGRLLLAQDKPNGAIAMLTGSADIDPDEADVFLSLARAHARAPEQELEAEWQTHTREARAACRRTREIGGEGHPDT